MQNRLFQRGQHRLIHLVATALLPSMIAAVVLANQSVNELQLLGRLFHLSSIAGAVALLLVAIGRWSVPYVAMVGVVFVVGAMTLQRLPYEVSLNVMFLGAGTVVAWVARESATKALLAMTLVSGGVMLLQVLGVGEWTQALVTHGLLTGGGKVEVPLEPAFLVSAADFQGSFLQGRPSGLFHSNQFANLVVLVTFALTVTMQRPVNKIIGLALCVVSTLLLSKVVFLGVALMLFILFFIGKRQTSVTYTVMMAASLLGYAVLFPGLFQLFLINPHVLIVSIVVRVIDMAAALGGDADAAVASLRQLGVIDAGQMNDALVGRIVAENTTAGRSTAFVTLSHYTPFFLSAAASGLLAWLSIPSCRRAVRFVWRQLGPSNVLVALALVTFSLAADFLASGFFWAIAGFALPYLGSYSVSEKECPIKANATKAHTAAKPKR